MGKSVFVNIIILIFAAKYYNTTLLSLLIYDYTFRL